MEDKPVCEECRKKVVQQVLDFLGDQMSDEDVLNLKRLENWAEDIASRWDGETEKGEDKAICALEIVDTAKKLQDLLDEMSQY